MGGPRLVAAHDGTLTRVSLRCRGVEVLEGDALEGYYVLQSSKITTAQNKHAIWLSASQIPLPRHPGDRSLNFVMHVHFSSLGVNSTRFNSRKMIWSPTSCSAYLLQRLNLFISRGGEPDVKAARAALRARNLQWKTAEGFTWYDAKALLMSAAACPAVKQDVEEYGSVWDAEETAHHESIEEIKALIGEAQHEHGADCAEVQRLAHVWSLMNAYFFEWMESHHSPLPQNVRNVTAHLGFTHELKAALLSKSMAVLQSRVRKMPHTEANIIVKWEDWPGEYLCKVRYTKGNEADAVVYLVDSENAATGDPIPFSKEDDDWRNTNTRGEDWFNNV